MLWQKVQEDEAFYRMRTKYPFLLLTMGAFLSLFRIGERDLWDPGETRYALVAREMRKRGNWNLPHLDERVYTENPPSFYGWLTFPPLF
jgi:4-amino-4-deoxy-L-arabinose transferase-like glycosyltransferase